MIINCKDKSQICKIIADKNYTVFYRGSRLYKNNSYNSDYDFGVIVPDDTEFVDIDCDVNCEKTDGRIHNSSIIPVHTSNGFVPADVQFVKVSDFIAMLGEHTPFALEALFSRKSLYDAYKEHFKLNTWSLRESFGAVVNNSWSKAHKKMTVEADLDMYCGAKSLFHSIRLQKLACQIASGVDKVDFTECNDLWNEIKSDLDGGKDWEYFKEKYKPIYNEAHSEMVKLCPKTEENCKKPSTRKKRSKKENNEVIE